MADDYKFNEDAYEQAIIALFRHELGYEYELGYDVERDYTEPFHRKDLEESLRRLNPTANGDVLANGLHTLTNIQEGTLLQNNEKFTEWLQGGLSVTCNINGEERTEILQLIDYDHPERNLFKVVNQWRVEEKATKRCDVVVMVNGLPLVVVELKSAIQEDASVHNAFNQIKNYQNAVSTLFTYNAFNVISDMSETRAGSITAGEDRYMEWKTVKGDYETTQVADYRTFFLGMFQKRRLLDILKNFICFDKREGSTAKILTAYHQYYAVRKAMERTRQAVEGSGKIGVFWHTQGSGKSLSMVFYAHQLIENVPGVTIVVVTDRTDLDNQLFEQFARCSSFLRQTPLKAESRADLGDKLRERKMGGIIFTTLQKFEEGETALSTRRNIVVISDEAHRSQYGEEVWDTKSQSLKKGFSRKMREALPCASFIGFTGTPISERDRDTVEVFGNYIDIYDMSQAVDDGATRPVYYESRVIKLKLDEKTLQLLDEEFDKLADEGATDEQIDKAKHEHSGLKEVLGEDATIDTLVRDIVEHYEQNCANILTGKAMIVALTRKIGIKIYRKILELRPDWTEKVKVVMSSSNNDKEDEQKIIGTDKDKKELARRFKDNSDPMKIAVVCDMWLTGFDVPSLTTMYMYKPMRGHNLMQAIARVNRVFSMQKDGEEVKKEGGLIVDYVGIAKALKLAMQQYTNRDRRRFGDPDVQKTALQKWFEEMEICRDMLYGFDYSGFFEADNTKKAAAITGGVNFLSAPNKTIEKKCFMEHALTLGGATTLCRSLLNDKRKMEQCYMEAVRVMFVKLAQKGKVSRREINERIGQLLTQSVKSEGVINLIGSQAKQVEFSLFDEAFMREVKNMKERNLAVELLTRLMKDRIRQQQKVNVTQSDRFSDMLSRSLSNYLKGLLTNEEVIEELLRMAEQMRQAEQEGDKLNLSAEEKAFYDALSTPEGVKQAYTDEEFVALTRELTETLRSNRTIDWNRKESARAKMRVLVKRLLKIHKYPPEGAEQALETVMRQCDHWADNDENLDEI